MTSNKNKKYTNPILILSCWALPMTWVVAIPFNSPPAHADAETSQLLEAGQQAIQSFVKEYAMAPRTLAELKTYARLTNANFSGWDSYGQRFDYLRLSQNHWYLRSFGADGRQNTLLSKKDPLTSSMKGYKTQGIIHSYSTHAIRYNPAIRLGALSPKGTWHAEIFADKISGASRLLVRHQANDDYFMITEQDTVEEFYWLPDGYRIAFTSAASNRYRDGIYLWNLLSDEIINIFPGTAQLGITTSDHEFKNWNLSLAGVIKEPPTLMAFVAPQQQNPTQMADFFSERNFITIHLDENQPTLVSRGSPGDLRYQHPLNEQWTPLADISKCEGIKGNHSKWCKLKVAGAFQTVLESWQEFAEKASDTPIFSYALFQLLCLYNDTFTLLKTYSEANPEDQNSQRSTEMIRSYGAELSHALATLPTAPTWQRAFATMIRDSFNAQTPLPFRVSNLSIEGADDFSPPVSP